MGVREGLLALLARGPRHGYQLKQEFEAATSNVWPLNIGQVYTTLQRLERDDLVTAGEPEPDGRVLYGLTHAGRHEVATWFTTPVDRTAPARDEVAIKLLLAIEAPVVAPADVVEAQRVATLTALQDYTGLRATARDGDNAWRLQLDRLIMLAEAELRWLDRVDEGIEQGLLVPRAGHDGDDATPDGDATSAARTTTEDRR